MASYIAIFLSLVCIILLIILLARFKKYFSPDSVIEKARIQMNKMVSDINNQTNRDLELIREANRRVKALLSDADQKMDQFKQATDRLREMIAIADKLEEQYEKPQLYYENKNISNIKPVGQYKRNIATQNYTNNQNVDPNASFQLTTARQGSLFDEEADFQPESKSILKDETTVTPDGAAYKEVPLIVTKIFDEKPVINKTEKQGKQLNENIRKLFSQGYQVEEIAKKLSCSITEVQFIIDML